MDVCAVHYSILLFLSRRWQACWLFAALAFCHWCVDTQNAGKLGAQFSGWA